MSMRKTTLAPGQRLRSVHTEKSYLGRPVTWCCTTGNPPLEVASRQGEIHVNSYRRQTMHRGKVEPGVSELPRGNELSRDHVNRPQKGCSPQVEVKYRKTKKWNLPPTGNGPHSSDGGNPYIKTNLHTGCFRKIAKQPGTQIASCAHIYMAFKHILNWKSKYSVPHF